MARTPQPVGFNDPALLNAADQSTPSVAKTSPPSLNRNGTVSTPGGTVSRGIAPKTTNGTTTFNQAVQATSGTEVFIVSSNNNDSNDIVTVYNTDKTISVSAVNQTYNSYNVTNTDTYGNSNVAAFLPTYTGDLGAGSLTVAGTTNLGDLSNIYIGGGTNGQVLSTNGLGALIWSTVTSGGGTGNITFNGDNIGSSNNIVTIIANNFARIQSNGQIWTFNNDGNLTLPSNTSSINYANGSPYGGGGSYGNSNVATFLASFGSNTITTTGNANVGNLNAVTTVTASRLISNVATGTAPFTVTSTTQVANLNVATAGTAGTVTTNSQPNITSVGTLASLSVTANANVGNIGATGGVFTTIAGSLTTNSQPNITSTGTLTSLSVTANANVGNLNTGGIVSATGNITGANLTTGGALSVTGNANVGNIGGAAGVFTTVAGSLTTAIQSNVTRTGVLDQLLVANTVLADGYGARTGSDLTISTAGNGNLIISPAGTGVTNFSGKPIANASTISATGNANVGNIGATGGVFTTVAGSLTTNSQPNITSVGTLTTLSVSGNATVGNLIGILANGNSNVSIPTSSDNVYINVNGGTSKQWIFDTAGNLRAPGNIDIYGAINFPQQVSSINWSTYNIELSQYGRINTNVDFFANANTIGALYLKGDGSNITNISTPVIANGNSNVNIPTANGNINISSAGNANIIVITGAGANITGTLSATGNITGNYFIGNGSQLTDLNTSSISNGTSNVIIETPDGNVYVNTLAGDYTWTFNNAGNLIAPGAISATGNITGDFFIGNGSQLTGLNTSSISNGTSNVSIATTDGNVTITTGGTDTWTFDTTGNLTFPDSSVQTTAPVAEFPFSVQSSNFVANAGARYGVNTTGGAVTATLPATPATGIAIFFADAGGAYATNNLTINRNGQTIMGSATNLTVSTDNQSVGLFYNGTTWRIYNAG